MEKPSVRATRFALQLPLRYRAIGESGWHEGLTENISRSGVLFHAEDLLQIATPLEITFTLPAKNRSPEVFCRGQVVRTVPPSGSSDRPALAATIADYQFLRPEA